MIRVAIVDDHPIFLEGVIHVLKAVPDIDVVGSGASAADAVAIGRDLAPDVLILDLDMPGSGATAVEVLASTVPSVRALMLTVVADEERAIEVLQKGARGYLLKGIGGRELVHAVRVVHGGQRYVMPTLATDLMAHLERATAGKQPAQPCFAGLSAREVEIVSLIAKGCSNKEIGIRLDLSDKTIKHYVTGVLQKLGVRNRVEAALLAARAGSRPQI